MDNRTLNERLDALGLQRSASVGLQHTHFSGALVGENLLETLEIYGEILTRPHLQTEQFEMCRQLALQTIGSYDDDPRQKISLLVHEDYLPYPLGRPAPGKIEELEKLTLDEIKAFWKHSFTPDSTIIAVAGNIDFQKLNATIEQCFSSWQGQATPPPNRSSAMGRSEALAVLGLEEGADKESIINSHRHLMQKLHPDRGGNDYLAAKLNQAKDFLLG